MKNNQNNLNNQNGIKTDQMSFCGQTYL